MKKRILFAASLSVFVHWLILGLNWGFLKDRNITIPKCRNVTITMSYKEPKPSAGPPQPEKTKIRKLEIKPRMTLDKKEITKPPEKKEAAAEPVTFEPEVKEAGKLENEIPDDTISGIESTADDESATAFIREAIPQYRINPPPVYPRVARRRGHQGTVFLEVLVDRSGGVRDLRVLKSSGYATLDDAALSSVKNWLFEPGMRGDQPVEMWVKLPVRFQLK